MLISSPFSETRLSNLMKYPTLGFSHSLETTESDLFILLFNVRNFNLKERKFRNACLQDTCRSNIVRGNLQERKTKKPKTENSVYNNVLQNLKTLGKDQRQYTGQHLKVFIGKTSCTARTNSRSASVSCHGPTSQSYL